MSRAGAQLAAGLNLAALAHVAAESGKILVINVADVIRAILADLAAGGEAAAAARGTARAACAWATLGATKAAGPRFPVLGIL